MTCYICTLSVRIQIRNKSSRTQLRNIVTTNYPYPTTVSDTQFLKITYRVQKLFKDLPRSLLFEKLGLSLWVLLSLQFLEIRIRMEPHNLTHPDQFKCVRIWIRILFLIVRDNVSKILKPTNSFEIRKDVNIYITFSLLLFISIIWGLVF